MRTTLMSFVSLLLIAVATIGSAKAQDPQTTQTPKYTIKFASGMDDTAHWSFNPAAAHTTGVEAGTQVTLTYSGSLRVKSITVSTVNPVETPLTFVAKTANATVAMAAYDGYGFAPTVSLEYSTDGGSNWSTYSVGTTGDITLTNVGDAVQFRATSDGNTTLGDFENDAYNYFTLTGDCYAYGNVMSLLYNDFDEETTFPEGSNSNFFYLFKDCSTLYNHPSVELVLPATQLTNYCYSNMFYACSGLTSAPELPATTLTTNCYQSMFSGCTHLTAAPELPATTLADKCYNYMFNGCSDLTSAPELPATTLDTNCYQYMFQNCTTLTAAPALPATTLAMGCYSSMFYACSGLTSAPALPATTLASDCYNNMFGGCSGLTSAPELPATTLTSGCYKYMFSGCSGLTSAPVLPATTLASGCYIDMFSGCSGLTSAPELPATTLTSGCYIDMFYGCTALTAAPTLPATTLAEKCYYGMFYGCTALTTAPELPATTLANYCYSNMFQNCTTLTAAPALPATQLANYCYNNMFRNCSSLTMAPALPATTLASNCYSGMFYGCSGLTSAPELPATTLVSGCYREMFKGCSSLNYIKCMATDMSATGCLTNWVSGVPTGGNFYCYSTNGWPSGTSTSGIPSGWTVHAALSTPLTFEAKTAGATVTLTASSASAPAVSLQYSTDGGSTWTDFTVGTTSVTLTNVGDAVQFRATSDGNTTLGNASHSHNAYNYFTISEGDCYAYGNVMSLLYTAAEFPTATSFPDGSNSNFYYLFKNCSTLYNHPSVDLVLPATQLDNYCYNSMFRGCTHLTEAPELPATQLANFCYNYMFYGCISLTSAPELPATTLANYCYYGMFQNCTTLTAAPALPATTLTSACYRQMFYGCTSLTSAPELPATTLFYGCYLGMFNNCSALTAAPELPATTLANYCYYDMFNGCTGLTSAPELPATTLANYCYNNMFQNCTTLTAAPALPATQLAESCYYGMFQGCTALTTAPELPATTLADGCYSNMFSNCSSLTTGPTISATTFGNSGECGSMFDGCSSLNSITWTGEFSIGNESAMDFAQTHLSFMLPSGSTGTINCPSSMTDTWNALKGYINGGSWTVGDPYSATTATTTPLTFEAMEAGATVTLAKNGSAPDVSIQYSTDGGSSWSTYTVGTTGAITLTNVGDKVQFRASSDATNTRMASSASKYNHFTLNGSCYVYGNVMSLLSQDFSTATTLNANYTFASLFKDCSTLYSHPTKELVLPATSLRNNCYYQMFYGCTNLTTAPALPATTLTSGCYRQMFQDCTNLNYIKCLATDISASNCLNNWVSGVSSTGTFVKKTGMNGDLSIPILWTIQEADN